jgi:FKBP-type peptidyl-prolyl cis-trans isomerase FklB
MTCLALTALQVAAQPPEEDAMAAANAANLDLAQHASRLSPMARAELERAAAADRNSRTAANFLTSNRAMRGVTNLPSGLQYRIVVAGRGPRPTDADSVRCRYAGVLADGTSFDKSDDRSATVLRVAGLLPGLQEAVKMMPAGSKWEVVLPPQLGYGARGHGQVAPNAVLIYTFELLDVI